MGAGMYICECGGGGCLNAFGWDGSTVSMGLPFTANQMPMIMSMPNFRFVSFFRFYSRILNITYDRW